MATGQDTAASGGETLIRYVEETEGYNCDPNGGTPQPWPVPPASNPNTKLTDLRVTGVSLEQEKQTGDSGELVSGAVTNEILNEGRSTRGGVDFLFRPDEYDPFLAAAIRAVDLDTASPAVDNQGITATMVAATRTLTGTGIATGLPAGTAAAGWFVRIRGFTEAGNNASFLVASAPDANTIVLAVGAVGLVDETSGASAVSVYSEMIENGSEFRSFLFEREFSDKPASARPFTYFPGYMPDWSIEAGEQRVEGSITGIGARPITSVNTDGSTVGDGSPNASTTKEAFRSEDNIALCLIDNTDIGTVEKLSTFSMSTNNNYREDRRIKTGVEAGRGRLAIEGQLTSDFLTNEFQKRNYEHMRGSLAFGFSSEADMVNGDSYIFYIPRIVIVSGDPNPSGPDDAVEGTYDWGAEKDPVTGSIIRIFKFPANP